MIKKIRAIARLLFFLACVLFIITEVLLKTWVLGANMHRAIRIRQRVTRWFLPKMGVNIQKTGELPFLPGIIACNHRSYLDPAVLACDTFFLPVSKAEVANWPVIGYGARVSGVLFLKRENTGSRKLILDDIGTYLKKGFPILLFPEGTTHAAPLTHPFRPASFLLAAKEGFPVLPVMIEYANPADYWIDNDNFIAHFIRRFGEKRIQVRVHYGAPIFHSDGMALLEAAKNWIDGELLKVRKESEPIL
ncbi:MAG: 1-acyl-sn-glycerol-3-phosphate acyltransferase [Bacteroidetes bacterium]|nr:1-acyl-sn-glycerol-3-phosphate acyltransferase [Bacteroidota bacterium]